MCACATRSWIAFNCVCHRGQSHRSRRSGVEFGRARVRRAAPTCPWFVLGCVNSQSLLKLTPKKPTGTASMDKPPYKLSSVLLGHSADVRAVATFLDGTVVSVSRDQTARVWKPTGLVVHVDSSMGTRNDPNSSVYSCAIFNPF